MFKLPLFPLNTVLFPGMPLVLHIFEDRYKLMIGKCIQERQPFGVVLIRQGVEALGPAAEPHPVGCTALIRQVQRLEQGRMNISAVGRSRFRVVSFEYDLPYLVGNVETYPLASQQSEEQAAAARRLRPWVALYMETLSQVEGVDLDPENLPEEPVDLAYLAATVLQVPAGMKQGLLATEQATALLNEIRGLYRQEVAFLKNMLARNVEDPNPFSLN